MSWICDYCSTANEDHDTECFVCGRERSKESIMEAKRAAREERMRHIHEVIYKSTTITGKVLCVSSIVLFSVISLIVLYVRMRSGLLGDLVYVGIAIVENVGENLAMLYQFNVRDIFLGLLDSAAENIGDNFESICLVVFCKDASAGDSPSLRTILSQLVINIGENFRSVAYNVAEIVQKVKVTFSQF